MRRHVPMVCLTIIGVINPLLDGLPPPVTSKVTSNLKVIQTPNGYIYQGDHISYNDDLYHKVRSSDPLIDFYLNIVSEGSRLTQI